MYYLLNSNFITFHLHIFHKEMVYIISKYTNFNISLQWCHHVRISAVISNLYIQLFRERLSEKKHQSARDKTERWYGYSLEFCILA